MLVLLGADGTRLINEPYLIVALCSPSKILAKIREKNGERQVSDPFATVATCKMIKSTVFIVAHATHFIFAIN